ncbi:hypothetical protein [Rhizobium sp. 007]|uniref:hypothetical protein n=1 Tax=Rhizobium sp. 007 TaxID=2785056 RepID=UPI00188FDBB6|nr:hypothetical protein [Rhizobium sp. 007]QPB18974.1 hypothetical protein ISN39_15430 [Rhizobium sp. 007]
MQAIFDSDAVLIEINDLACEFDALIIARYVPGSADIIEDSLADLNIFGSEIASAHARFPKLLRILRESPAGSGGKAAFTKTYRGKGSSKRGQSEPKPLAQYLGIIPQHLRSRSFSDWWEDETRDRNKPAGEGKVPE